MNKTLNNAEILNLLRARVMKSSQTQVASELGVGKPFLNDVLHGRRAITERLAAALGYQRLIIFKKVA